MKGFKPTGYGPSSGFKYPSRMGFTGSTGAVSNVTGYTRRKGYADGGFVRQDTPRMKSDMTGDTGSALVRRARSSTNLDQVSGGKTPLRPGFKKGGMAKKRMKKADGGAVREILQKSKADWIKGERAMTKQPLDFKRAAEDWAKGEKGLKRRPLDPNDLKKLAGGGRVARGSSAKGFLASLRDVPAAMNMVVSEGLGKIKRSMSGRERTVEGRDESIDESVTDSQTGKMARNYRKGGAVRLADGGSPDKFIRANMPEKKSATQAEKIERANEVSAYGKRQRASIEHNLAEYKSESDPSVKKFVQKANDMAFGVPNHTPNLSKTRDFKPRRKNYASGGRTQMTKC